MTRQRHAADAVHGSYNMDQGSHTEECHRRVDIIDLVAEMPWVALLPSNGQRQLLELPMRESARVRVRLDQPGLREVSAARGEPTSLEASNPRIKPCRSRERLLQIVSRDQGEGQPAPAAEGACHQRTPHHLI